MIKIETDSQINIISGMVANNKSLVREIFNIKIGDSNEIINEFYRARLQGYILKYVNYILDKLEIKSLYQNIHSRNTICIITDIFINIFRNTNDRALIVNPENGLHYKALIYIWEAIKEFAIECNCKLFVITQSYEFLEIVVGRCTNNDEDLESFEKQDLSYFRLEFHETEDNVTFTKTSYDELKVAIEHMWEVR